MRLKAPERIIGYGGLMPDRLSNTTSRLIALAVSLVGDSHKVREHMKCSDADFFAFSEGHREPSWPELDRLITLIVHEQGSIIAKNRELLAEQRARRNK